MQVNQDSVLGYARIHNPELAKFLEAALSRLETAGDLEEKIRSFVPKFKDFDDQYSMQLLDAFAQKHLGCSANEILNSHALETTIHAELDVLHADRQDHARRVAAEISAVSADLPDTNGIAPKALPQMSPKEIHEALKQLGGFRFKQFYDDTGINKDQYREWRTRNARKYDTAIRKAAAQYFESHRSRA